MQPQNIVFGYSDLLRQFQDRTRTLTELKNLSVIFYLENHDLVAVEKDGAHNMVLAIYNGSRKSWRYELVPGSPALQMVQNFCERHDVENVPEELNRVVEYYSRMLF